MIAALLDRRIARLELEHIDIEIRQSPRLPRAQREMAEAGFLLPFSLGIDLGSVLVTGLREVEIVAGWIMRAVARKRPVARPLDDLDVGIFPGYPVTDPLEVRNLDAEMIEPGLASATPGNERHAEIAVAHRDGADLARGIARGVEAEHRTVEHAEQRVAVAGDGEMVELAKHACLPAGAPSRAPAPFDRSARACRPYYLEHVSSAVIHTSQVQRQVQRDRPAGIGRVRSARRRDCSGSFGQDRARRYRWV